MAGEERYWAVVPAAGVGARMGAGVPKQYLKIAGRRVIEHTLGRLCAHRRVSGAVVALAEADPYWARVRVDTQKPLRRVAGGAERCNSVLNALETLRSLAAEEDWVLVHDAARPCLRAADLDALMDGLAGHPVGGLLGLPVRDTMKRAAPDGAVRETVSRDGLWHALTPQMFRLGMLREALQRVIAGGGLVTDEAQAMELAGMAPRMVEGHADNIKITRPQDLALAELYLRQQGVGNSE